MAAITDATALNNWVNAFKIPELKKQVGNQSIVLQDLMANKKPSGGRAIRFTARIALQNRTMGGGEGWVADPLKVDTTVTPEVPHVKLIEPFDLSADRLEEISGSNDKVGFDNYMEERTGNASESILNYLSRSVYSDGVAVATSEGRMVPNLSGFAVIGARDTAYAGISTAVAPTWNPMTVALDGASGSALWAGIAISGTAPTYGNWMTEGNPYYAGKLLGQMITLCTWENKSPDRIVCGPVMYEAIQSYLDAKKQLVNATTADGGFDIIKWRGRTIAMDKNCPAGEIDFYVREFLEFRCVPGQEVTSKPIAQRVGTDWLTGFLKFGGNMVYTSRRHFGRYTGLFTSI